MISAATSRCASRMRQRAAARARSSRARAPPAAAAAPSPVGDCTPRPALATSRAMSASVTAEARAGPPAAGRRGRAPDRPATSRRMFVSCSATPRSIAYCRARRIAVAEDLDADQPDRRRDADAVLIRARRTSRSGAAPRSISTPSMSASNAARGRSNCRRRAAASARPCGVCGVAAVEHAPSSSRHRASSRAPASSPDPPRPPHRRPRGRSPRPRRSRGACPAAAPGTSSRSWCRGPLSRRRSARTLPPGQRPTADAHGRGQPSDGRCAGRRRSPRLEPVENARCRRARSARSSQRSRPRTPSQTGRPALEQRARARGARRPAPRATPASSPRVEIAPPRRLRAATLLGGT